MSANMEDRAGEYDYIVCGGGTAGCVVAARLAEDHTQKILVIEAGSDGKENEWIKMSGGLMNLVGTDADWNLTSVPMAGIDGRKVPLTRGRLLGGSSGANATLCVRGTKQDYDDWDLPGWSGEEMFKLMSKAENFHNKPWFDAVKNAHGYDGELHTEPHDLAPISKLLMESMVDRGLPFHADMFSTGDVAQGCGHAVRTHYKGVRSIGADFLTDSNTKGNIDIVCDTVVDKVNFDTDLRATSVDVVEKSGNKRNIKARTEIILCGGSYCSPTILLRSGIGPRAELETLSIPCLFDSPGVGKNLRDHLIVIAFYEVSEPGLTHDHFVHHSGGAASAYDLYKDTKTGFLSTFPFGAMGYARLDDRLDDSAVWKAATEKAPDGRDAMHLTDRQPHVEIFNSELYLAGSPEYNPTDNQHSFGMVVELFSPRSAGTVTITSQDALTSPVVDCNYLSDPLDLLVLSEGLCLANEIVMKGAGTKNVVKGSWPPTLTNHTHTNRDDWIPYIRQSGMSCYHPAGTCKMGRSEDVTAVLDEKLRVRGVKGLRVADCSVMPTLNCGHTQMPAYAIGERAALLIREESSFAS